jgi:two-component system cell cycle sensor histidine kinase/response regulator CckA
MTQSPQDKLHEDKSRDGNSRALRARSRAAGAASGGSIAFVLLIALLLFAATAGLIIGRAHAQPYIFALLAVLATVGVFLIFALAAGLLRGSTREGATPLLKAVLDGTSDGILVTDAGARILYANAAYRKLVTNGAGDELRSIERAFVGDARVSEAIYRLLKAARAGRRAEEEVRIGARSGEGGRALRIRVRPLGQSKHEKGITVWSLAEGARGNEPHANVSHELRAVADYLDHAPAGFFSADADGRIAYLNATLADWIEHDRAQPAGNLTLDDIVAGEGAALLTTLSGEPGEVKTEIRDIDLKTRGGRTVPARLYHRVAFDEDGAAGASRTLVLNRARSAGDDPQRTAEIRFMRFFQNTPMAIATVDREGRIADSNARFARLFQGAFKGETERTILAVVAARDRAALEAAIRKAAEGHGEIAPVEAALAVLRHRHRGRATTRARGGDRLRARHHAAAHPREPPQSAAEDGDDRPARGQHCARLQQSFERDYDGDRLSAQRAQADRSLVP